MASPLCDAETPPFDLNKVPLEILQLICQHLAAGDPQKPALRSFSEVNRACFIASGPERFRELELKISGADALRETIPKCLKLFKCNDRLRYLRTLKISGHLPWEEPHLPETSDDDGDSDHDMDDNDGDGNDYWGSYDDDDDDLDYNDEDPRLPWYRPFTLFPPQDLCSTDLIISRRPLARIPITEQERQREDAEWMPLAQFIEELPLVQDIVFACSNQIPRCILSAIHKNCPRARLHMPRFHLRSLRSDAESPIIDPAELALATSPSLYSIGVVPEPPGQPEIVDCNEPAMVYMMRGLAPNLSHIIDPTDVPSDDLVFSYRTPMQGPFRLPWEGFNPAHYSELLERPAPLQSLQVTGHMMENSARLETWGRFGVLRQLRSLVFKTFLDISDLRDMMRMARRGDFKALRSLKLVGQIRQTYSQATLLDDTCAQFLQLLDPLEHLTLKHHIGQRTWNAVLKCHGESLRKLSFVPSFSNADSPSVFLPSPSHVQELAALPRLARLKLPMAWPRGNGEKLAFLRALGRLPSLQKLSLLLCSAIEDKEWRENAPSSVSFPKFAYGQEVCRMEASEIMAAVAVDSQLALSMLNVMNSRTVTTFLLDTSREGWKDEVLPGIFAVLAHISTPVHIQRDIVSGDIVSSIDSPVCSESVRLLEETRFSNPGVKTPKGHPFPPDIDIDPIYEAWTDIWPHKSTKWWNDWSSFPLEQGTAGAERPIDAMMA